MGDHLSVKSGYLWCSPLDTSWESPALRTEAFAASFRASLRGRRTILRRFNSLILNSRIRRVSQISLARRYTVLASGRWRLYPAVMPCKKLILVLWLAAVAGAFGAETILRTPANVMVELPLAAKNSYRDPLHDVILDVVFTDPAGHEARVPAFWAGGNLWKVRYASPLTGTHSFRSQCSPETDAGLNGVTGTVEVTAYQGDNPLYQHGPLRISANHRSFEYRDGTPFFWLGDTWWMGLSHRLHWPDEFQQLTADRKAKGFNVVQIVAGLYPDMFPFDPRGANEAGFPWETNYASIRPAYFDAADQRLFHLVQEGLTPCIVGAWGYFMPWMGVEKMKAHWRYLIARYGALPVVWCAAGEANLPWYLAKGFPYDDRNQVHDWTEVMRYIRATDPWHRLLTVHPTGLGPLTSRHATDDPALLDFDMLQTPHGRSGAVVPTVQTVRRSYAAEPVMPVIDGEASYEMLNDSLPTEWTRRMFWLSLMNGAAGHTYGANGIWQCNRPGDPHGASPHGGTYGKISWDDAMRLPGSRQMGFGKRFFEQFAWQEFRPHPEWVVFVHWQDNDPQGPQSAGISNVVRVVYVPEVQPVEVRGLSPASRYGAEYFDVVNGTTTPLGEIQSDQTGNWICSPPAGMDHDWVVVLKSR